VTTVVDASVVLRLLLENSQRAAEVVRRGELAAPAVIVPETGNGLAKEVRFGRVNLEQAESLLDDALALPIELVPDAEIASNALRAASRHDLSVYDASYIALAERLRAPLVTADRRLAERYSRSELIA